MAGSFIGSSDHVQDALSEVPWAAYSLRQRADESFVLEQASEIGRALLGLGAAPWDGDAWLARVCSEDRLVVVRALARAAREMSSLVLELRVVLPDGELRWIELRGAPRREPHGGIVVHAVAHDVTERKRGAAELRASEVRTQLLIEHSPAAIALLDRDMTYVACSPAWVRAYGGGRERVVGLRHYDLYPSLPERFREAHRRGLAGETSGAAEDPWAQPDGTTRWTDWAVRPWRDAAGDVGGIVLLAEDVTERRLAQEEQRASDRRYRELVELAPAAVFVHCNRRILLANAAASALFEAGAEGLVGRPVWDVIPPEIRDTVERRIAELDAGQTVPPVITRLQTVAGRRIDVEVHVASVRGPEGVSVIVVARDLADQLRAQEALRTSAQRLSAIVHSMLDGIVAVDEALTIVLTNPAADEMFGYAPGALLGHSLDELIPASRRFAHQRALGSFADTGPNARFMGGAPTVLLEGLRADGSTFPTATSISRVMVEGRPLYTAIHRELEPTLRAENALRDQRERFQQLAESIREVFWLRDRATWQLLYVSPAYEAIWGRSCASLYERSSDWLEAVHPDDRAHVEEALPQRTEGHLDLEYRIVTPDGTVRWVHDRAFPVRDAAGVVVRIAGVAEDVTQRRSLQEQVRQTQRLESLALLAGGVAHDFNNLLTVITSSAELLGDAVSPADADLLSDILDAGQRGATLTRQLLAFTRQEVVTPRAVPLSVIVRDAERLLRRLIGEDIRIEIEAPSMGGLVRVDPGQWSQVLLNLAVNARDAMPHGGMLRIRTRSSIEGPLHPPALAQASGGWEVLEVSDDGTGMSPEVRARIFEPFFTTKERGLGTGLGLAVVYGVVQQSRGAIEVESSPGNGTTFRIYVPTYGGVSSEPIVGSAADSSGGTERVLLVEDDDAVRRIAARALQTRGYDVVAAADGAAALELVHDDTPPALLVTDVVMPGLDGVTLAERLRVRFPHLKVLFTSGYIDDTLTRRGLDREHAAFLQKPYSPQMLARRIRDVLDA